MANGIFVSLGHYPEYIEVAERIDALIFSISASEWSSLDDDERWAANRKFLDDRIAEGAKFVLSTPPHRVRPDSYFEMELKYLMSMGYVVRRGATHWELVR